jgi:hypothetical protein
MLIYPRSGRFPCPRSFFEAQLPHICSGRKLTTDLTGRQGCKRRSSISIGDYWNTVHQLTLDLSDHSTVLRAVQRWTALTGAGKQEGSLLLYPDVKTTIAYVLLRPFFSRHLSEKEEDIMDATKSTFDISTSWFPGTFKMDSQMGSPSSHPHLRMWEFMVNILRMEPGDTIWWHCDMLHAVEVDHLRKNDASVVYIAATPTTEMNKIYVKKQAEDFLNGGAVPGDFQSENKREKKEGTVLSRVGLVIREF